MLRRVAAATTDLIYLQIVIGATMRHTGAGLAIPDFPLMFGQLTPPHWDAKIAVHFAHRVGALLVSLAILATTAHVFYHHRTRRELRRPSLLLLALLVAQITLGAMTVLSGKQFIINSLHVVTGASVLVTSLVLGTGWEWKVHGRFGVQVFGAQHVAALGDLQANDQTVENVMGNFWSLGTALVFR